MVKYDYAEESKLVMNIIYATIWCTAVLLGVLFCFAEGLFFGLLLSFGIGVVMSLCMLPVGLTVGKVRKKHKNIVLHCDYQTHGKVIDINEKWKVIRNYSDQHTVHFLVEYIDQNNACRVIQTPAVRTALRKCKVEDNLVCDVYIKGEDVIAQNFHKQ